LLLQNGKISTRSGTKLRFFLQKQNLKKMTDKLQKLNEFCQNTLVSHLGIVFTDIGEDFISASMPVDERHIQPLGYLHGGSSVVLAETLGSVASNMLIDKEKQIAFGLEVNANHIKSVRAGTCVSGTAKAVHIGRSTHVWNIEIRSEKGELIAVSRLTVSIVNR
jgi:1,4-dihydroxy-2-naphthoyl-CoA hydrolase